MKTGCLRATIRFGPDHGVILAEPQEWRQPLNARYVGLDAHSKSCVYEIQDENGRSVGRGTVPTTPGGLALLGDREQLPRGTRVALRRARWPSLSRAGSRGLGSSRW